MRKLVFTALVVLCFLPISAYADRITLTTAETLAVPTSAKLYWRVSNIDATAQTLQVTYQWLDANSRPIRKSSSGDDTFVWTCQDRDPQLVANCIMQGDPYACCTGPGAGTGCDPGSTCFADVFGFVMRTQDVGTKIGLGLRTLIWNKFKADLLSAGNAGTFDAN